MIILIRYFLELTCIAFAVGFIGRKAFKNCSNVVKCLFAVLCFCCIFASTSVSLRFTPKRRVIITALEEKSEDSKSSQVYFRGFSNNKKTISQEIEPVFGTWKHSNGVYAWFEKGDERRADNTTNSIAFDIEYANNTFAVFTGNDWKGKVEICVDNEKLVFDTFCDSADSQDLFFLIPKPSEQLLLKATFVPPLIFGLSFTVLLLVSALALRIAMVAVYKVFERNKENAAIKKIQKYRFLFEELVKRDFKKKYKRTVLGMAWSVLQPLLTLLVMRLVFTEFFGRGTLHYTTYLFCGNLVFSYFNESTSQGMASLMSNSGIFTKVNVPKYLFLLSKNVQTLINFGLTLCVFFVFCLLDGVSFSWRFVFLIYPIVTLVVFNIGVGLILSALFVFFRDIQYLWSVFTMLLMYMSAIFYRVDSYATEIQKLFLINPVYAHIKYFRTIVLDRAIPSVSLHCILLLYSLIVLGLGSYIYKRYNTEFLYYV